MQWLLDPVLIVYVLGVAVSLYGFGLFVWWWHRIGKATDVFICVALLFVCNAVSDLVAIYSRYLHSTDIAAMNAFHESALWVWRRVPELVILSLLCIKMTLRVAGVLHREVVGEVQVGDNLKATTEADAGEKRESKDSKYL